MLNTLNILNMLNMLNMLEVQYEEEVYGRNREQAGTELGQAQLKLKLKLVKLHLIYFLHQIY